jgi:uncharacterized protein
MVARTSRRSLLAWAGWVVGALLLMPLVGRWEWIYLLCVVGTAFLLHRTLPLASPALGNQEKGDLWVMALLYVAVVASMRLAFVVFGTDYVVGLFLCFAGALLLGVVGPIIYTVWTMSGSLADLGFRREDIKTTIMLAGVFAAVQFAITLWGYELPAAVDWVPLLIMALVVGVFEAVFFRGFIQNRLEAHFGTNWGVGDMAFLTGLGITYAVAFTLTRNLLVLWPLLTPLGSFFAQLEGGEIELPWASILGFADVAMLMAGAVWIAHRHEVKRRTRPATEWAVADSNC